MCFINTTFCPRICEIERWGHKTHCLSLITSICLLTPFPAPRTPWLLPNRVTPEVFTAWDLHLQKGLNYFLNQPEGPLLNKVLFSSRCIAPTVHLLPIAQNYSCVSCPINWWELGYAQHDSNTFSLLNSSLKKMANIYILHSNGELIPPNWYLDAEMGNLSDSCCECGIHLVYYPIVQPCVCLLSKIVYCLIKQPWIFLCF